MIKVINADKYYNRGKRNQIHVIDNTTLEFEDKGMVAILGNSGCGKTTLLNTIGGLDKPTRGKIYVDGKRMNSIFSSKTDNIRNKNIGYIFQNYQLIDNMSVFDNVALVLKMLGVRNKDEIKRSVNYVLETVGLYKYRNRPANTLSGGERQRVGIARAIVKNPKIIIADEPTGNLDSKNSLEVMNIIKAISKDKLVILVTHEKDLAHFYATRIIELVDGKVTNDYENEHDDELDYRIDNKIYLLDMPVYKRLRSPELNIDFYSDGSKTPQINIVIKNGNLYIQNEQTKTEVVDDSSAIELVNDNYRKLSKDEYEAYQFDYDKITINKKKIRYHSIYNPFTLLINGFKKVLNYPILKKILLAGFIASSMFIMYAISNAIGITTVTDDEFITVNKNYLLLSTGQNTVSDYKEYEKLDGVGYILPGDSMVCFKIDYSDYYYQTNNANDNLNGSLASLELIDKNSLIYGRMPENEYEVVIDKMTLNSIFEYGSGPMVGLNSPEDFVGKIIELQNGKEYTISGICDMVSPSIYANENRFFEIYSNSFNNYSYGGNDADNTANITDVNTVKDKITITKGRMPEYDYEVIVNKNHEYDMKLDSEIDYKVNGKKLVVVGYYESKSNADEFYTNENTVKYKYIAGTSDITIYPADKDLVMDYFLSQNMDIRYVYDTTKEDYESSIKYTVKTTLIITAVILLMSLIEVFLMLRSSFLSRVKEVGTLRAIGLKKKDVYKMFLGEILAITITTSAIGFGIMGYVLSKLSKLSYFGNMYVFDIRVVLLSVIIVFFFNIMVGLLPVFNTLRKTPAQILSRTDVD